MDALNKKTVEDIDVKGKRVLARCDFNVPLKDGEITNDKRIVAALPTIKYLKDHGAKVILCSHLGRPKGEYKPEFSLAPVAAKLSEYLGQEVKLAEDPEVVGANAKAMAAELKDGDVMLLEKVRYRKEETKNEEAFSKELASLDNKDIGYTIEEQLLQYNIDRIWAENTPDGDAVYRIAGWVLSKGDISIEVVNHDNKKVNYTYVKCDRQDLIDNGNTEEKEKR